jgi:predicted P-loop ATPase
VDSKQVIERTLGIWIVEASDLAGKRRADIEQLKASVSRRTDGPARMAYARKSVSRRRQFILIGTTNNLSDYLKDPTGARRFWPITVTRFNLPALVRDRDQLWAEAVVRVRRGDSIRLPARLWPDAAIEQDARREVDPWEDTLTRYLADVSASGDERRRVTSGELFGALGIETARRDRTAALRVSSVMQRLNFVRATVWDSDTQKNVAGYIEVSAVASQGTVNG